MKPLHFYRELTPSSFERAIYGASVTTKSAQGWTEESIRDGILLDLSKVEFSEFSALAQVAMLVEGAARHGVRVKIALPRPKPRKGETNFIEQCRHSEDYAMQHLADETEKRILNRKGAFGFMRRCGFEEALRVSHVPGSENLIEIDTDYDSGEDDSQDAITKDRRPLKPHTTSDSFKEEYQYSAIFTLRWVVPMVGEALRTSKNFATSVINFKNIGLTEADARAIVGTVLGELIENVFEYAKEKESIVCAPYALVGAIALDPTRYKMGLDWFRPCLREFAEWAIETNSLIIQIIVADSGNGIPRVLGPYFGPENEDEIPSSKEFDIPLEKQEKIIFWAFNRWSTSHKELALAKLGTRGLWLVQRFVRAYHGTVTIRAEDAMVGWRYENLGDVSPVRDKNLRYVPGTFLNICLLPQVSVDIKKPIAIPSKKQQKPRFAVVRCQGSDDSILSERDVENLVRHLRKGTAGDHTCVIASLELSTLSSRATQDLFVKGVKIGCNIVNPNALALLLPNISLRQILDAAESINVSMDSPDYSYFSRLPISQMTEPLLVIDSKGKWMWVGSTNSVRELLTTLLKNEEKTLYEEEIEKLVSQDDSETGMGRWIDDHPYLVGPDGRFCLFLVTDINESIIAKVQHDLQTGVQAGHGCVRQGIFRTPTLQYVNRWTEVERFLKEETGIELAAYALARKLEAAGYIYNQNNISIVRVDTASAGVTASLSECLGIYNTIYSMPGELDVFRQLEVPRVPQGTNVILCTDLILSGNTARRAISELLRWDVRSVTVACVFDARTEKTRSIECMGKIFHLVSLAELDIIIPDASPSREIRNIDPVLREPIFKSVPRRNIDYEIHPDEKLHQWCQEEEGTLCFGHIERSIGRHFTIYLNPRKLIQEGATHREEILGLFVQHIITWIENRKREAGETTKNQELSVEIWFPGDPSDFAGEFAKYIKNKLSVDHPDIPLTALRGIRRAAFAGKWVFPQEIGFLGKNTHVIIVDWGSMTTSTVHQMMRLASEAGAASIKAILFLSQMPLEDEMVLTRQPAIKGVKSLSKPEQQATSFQKTLPFDIMDLKGEPGEYEVTEIPLEVVFLSSLRLNYYTPQECPICRVREALVNEEKLCPTELLRQHAINTNELLKEREREEVFRHPQRDLYGTPLTGQEIVDIIRLRQRLEDALRSTEERYTILCDLNNLFNDPKKRDAITWVRLLATEPIWLKLPPLRFDELRQKIARIALDIVLSDYASDVDPRMRQQGVIVLRAASKEIFITELPIIFEKCIKQRSVVQQLLYDTFTYLLKSYHESPHILEKVIANLEKCREYIQARGAEYDYSLEYGQTITSLVQATRFLEAKASIKTFTIRDSWKFLKEEYAESMMSMKLHYGAARRITDVWIPFQESIEARRGDSIPGSQRWKNSQEAWEECHAFLLAKILPYLRPLRKVLVGEYFKRVLSLEEQSFLASIVTEDFPYPGSDLTAILYSFIREPQSVLDPDKGEKFRQKYELWYNIFLRVPRGGEEEAISPPAKLLKLINSCPYNLRDMLESVISDMQYSGYCFDIVNKDFNELNYQVFCPQELLRDTLWHIIQNAAGPKHADPNRGKDRPSIYFGPPNLSAEHKMVFEVLNDGTKLTPPGKGSDSLNRQLEDFDGSVKGEALYGKDWSYKATITLSRW